MSSGEIPPHEAQTAFDAFPVIRPCENKPEACDDTLFAVIQNCLNYLPEERPTFAEVCKSLGCTCEEDLPQRRASQQLRISAGGPPPASNGGSSRVTPVNPYVDMLNESDREHTLPSALIETDMDHVYEVLDNLSVGAFRLQEQVGSHALFTLYVKTASGIVAQEIFAQPGPLEGQLQYALSATEPHFSYLQDLFAHYSKNAFETASGVTFLLEELEDGAELPYLTVGPSLATPA